MLSKPSRREFLYVSAGIGAALPLMGAGASQAAAWDEVPKILARIKPPVFAKRDFDITKFGAVAGKDASDAIRDAIAKCNAAGGGRVVIPQGTFLTGPVHLKSNVNLYLSEGARLLFDRDPKRYLPVVFARFEGTEFMNYSPFIYADGQENIAVTGPGTLDGNADKDHWWNWKDEQKESNARLQQMGQNDVPVKDRIFGDGFKMRPNFFQPVRCKNVMVEDVHIVNSPMWEITPLMCTNVIVRGIKVDSHGPNNDGCDPESCRDVLIENCSFSTGDDCIAIKAGRNRDGRRSAVPTENVIIRNCDMKDGHGGITIGSEMSAGVRNVFVENCRLSSPNLNQALRFKTNAMRGGTIENVYFRNITIGQISDAIVQIDFNYQEGANGPEKPVVRNIDIRDVTCGKAKYALNIQGFENAPITNIHLERCTFNIVAMPNVVKNVNGLELHEVKVNGKVLETA